MNTPFFAIKLYHAADMLEYRALFDANAQGTVIIRIVGNNNAWVWTALYGSIGILYSITATVKLSENETVMLAQEF